jgi:hypothetical protein
MDTIVKDTRTKKQIKQEARDKARDRLEKIVGVYDQDIFCIIRHVSQSGMTRHISFFNIVSGQPFFLDGLIRDYLGYRYNKTYTGLVVEGCGMDMAFSVVNHLQEQLNYENKKDYPNDSFDLRLSHRII